ncbi:MAG: THUMP domain-containing protein, partial [Phycisphaerales bacterium]
RVLMRMGQRSYNNENDIYDLVLEQPWEDWFGVHHTIRVDVTAYEGDDLEIGFNPQFIVDAMKVIQEPEVIMELKAPNKPGLIKSGNDFLYVVMPVSLS